MVALYPLSSPNHNLPAVVLRLLIVALYPLSSPNHNLRRCILYRLYVALYPLSSPNHNHPGQRSAKGTVALYPLSSPNHNNPSMLVYMLTLRYILFHHQTTTQGWHARLAKSCVISSFITKPQLHENPRYQLSVALYPLSSPNHNYTGKNDDSTFVALYPLSSPNHNLQGKGVWLLYVALYPLSSPNHNLLAMVFPKPLLRYILFHHQTTTCTMRLWHRKCCVISSFITKPQRSCCPHAWGFVALYPLSSPNHNVRGPALLPALVALYPLSSPNHNRSRYVFYTDALRYILFHHQTTTSVDQRART